jgi:acylphosphatase
VERRRVVYSGWVQGVGFRYTTLRMARGYDVTGFVRNLPDGRVELLAEGDPGTLDVFLGHVSAALFEHIDATEIAVSPATGEFDGFGVQH